MVVRYMWPKCDYDGAWNSQQDAFFVECTPDEYTTVILPRLPSHEPNRAGTNSEVYAFLISKDLGHIVPQPSHYPFANLWNGYSPFVTLPQQQLYKFEEITDLPLGPQSGSDGKNSFIARMRLHQSWYRHAVLKLPYGTGPSINSKAGRGNMLCAGDADLGRNFLTPTSYAAALDRLKGEGGKVEEFRLLRNMLSSQPMCFNLFGPLVRDHALATLLFNRCSGS